MAHYKAPSDLAQIPIVWRYELLKHMRSWRLLASIAIAFVVLALIFFLPPLLNKPYQGTDTDVTLTVNSIGAPGGISPYQSYGEIRRTGVNIDNMVIYKDGSVLPELNWTLVKTGNELSSAYLPAGVYAVFFTENLTGSVITATFDWRITPQDFETLNLQFVTILVIISATFFAADALVGEYYNRTGYLIFPNPLKREVLFFGKYAASITAGLIVIGAFYLGVAGLSLIAAGGLDDDLWLSFLLAFVYLLAAAAIGYLVSALLKGTTGAIVLTFMLLFLLLPIVDGVSMFAGVKISASLTFSANVLIYILVDPYPKDTTAEFGGAQFANYYPDPATSVVVMFAYMAVALALSLVLFKRKQLSG